MPNLKQFLYLGEQVVEDAPPVISGDQVVITRTIRDETPAERDAAAAAFATKMVERMPEAAALGMVLADMLQLHFPAWTKAQARAEVKTRLKNYLEELRSN